MEDKVTRIRNIILDKLENGELNAGDKLPGARDIATETGISLLTVQGAISSLVREGILDTRFRQGTFVNSGWKERVIDSHLVFFRPELTWLDGLRDILEAEGSNLRVCRNFEQGMFEIRTTIAVQENRNDYMDLTELMNEIYPDRDIFFREPFRNFQTADGKLIGIPFIFSPRIIFFNPKVFQKAGCKLPRHGWTWEEFMGCVVQLKKHLPGDQIFNWKAAPFCWMNFVFRAGGKLITPEADDPITIDDDRTRVGLKLFTELREALEIDPQRDDPGATKAFIRGELAMMMVPREELCLIKQSGFNDYDTVPLPLIPGGQDITAQATDLLCIRKNCTDFNAARDFIRLMLSAKVQEYVGQQYYGIPIRLSAATKSIDFTDSRDALFMTEATKMSAEYNLSSPDLTQMISSGISQIWTHGADVNEVTSELAGALRSFLKFNGTQINQNQLAANY